MSFPHLQADIKHVFYQKNFFAAASCWLLQEEKHKTIREAIKMESSLFQTNQRSLTCTWCSRRTGLTGWRWRLWNERWISRWARGAARGTLAPSQPDSGGDRELGQMISDLFQWLSCLFWSKPGRCAGPDVLRPSWPCADAPWCHWNAERFRRSPDLLRCLGAGLSQSVLQTHGSCFCTDKKITLATYTLHFFPLFGTCALSTTKTTTLPQGCPRPVLKGVPGESVVLLVEH